MPQGVSEEEMRRALFGDTAPTTPVGSPATPEPTPDVVFRKPEESLTKKKVAKAFTPRLRVTLRVGNEFEGKMFELTHEADTLSTLQAEQEATKAARKKFRYVEVVSIKSM